MSMRNAFEELASVSDISFIRRLFRGISRMSYDATNQLRAVITGSSVLITSGTVTTVTTMTTGNIGMGDIGKPGTAMMMTRTLTSGSNRRNITRS